MILIVDDREDDVLLLEKRLGRMGRIEIARDGRSALSMCKKNDYDIVMVDLRLPDIDGLELLSRVRKLRPRSPVIIMTAYGSEEIARKAIRMGASDYVIKPLDLKRITGIVKASLERRQLEVDKEDLERKLRSERDYLQAVVSCSADAIVVTDTSGAITLFSPMAEEMFGLPGAKVLGKSIASLLARGKAGMNRLIREINKKETVRNRGIDFLGVDGNRIITLLSGSILYDEERNRTGILFVIKDITRNIKLEREILESKSDLESVFDSIVDPMAVISPDYVVSRANMASARLAGLDVKETIGRPCHIVLNGSEERCVACPVEETYRTRSRAGMELRSDPLGEIFFVNSYPIFDYKGDLKGVIEHRKVITEQKRLEDERRRLEMELMEKHKLSSIGLLVQGVAHNLNTPLGVILGRSELLKAEVQEVLGEKADRLVESLSGSGIGELRGLARGIRESTVNCLDVILKQVEQMSDIIGNMMYKSRQEQDSERKRINLNQVLEEELTFLEADMQFKHEIEKNVDFDPKLPYIEGIYSDFSQSFTNIIRNAIDAMYRSEKKILTVTTRHDRSYVYVAIHDTGEGIKEENKSKLFDPFFTTKEFGDSEGGPSGVGLGLHSCYQLLNPYGVTFEVESRPGDTTFTIKVPIRPIQREGGTS